MKLMQRITAIFLCLLLLCAGTVTVIADNEAPAEEPVEEVAEPAAAEEPQLAAAPAEEDAGLSFENVDQSAVGTKALIPAGTAVYTKVLDLNEFFVTQEDYVVNVNKAATAYGFLWYKFASPIRDDAKVKYIWVKADDVRLEAEKHEFKELSENGVTVSGEMPVEADIAVSEVSFEEVVAIAPELAGIDGEILKTIDVSMLDGNGTEIQPDAGEPVAVTVDVGEDAAEGSQLAVIHVHENDDGTVTTEELGIYPVVNGKLSFSMSSFSYIIVVDPHSGSNITIQNVEAFFTVSGTSTNDHFRANTVYITSDGHVHLILVGDHSKATTIKADTISIDGTALSGITASSTTNFGRVDQLYVQNQELLTDVTDLLVESGYNYAIDIDLGASVVLNGEFTVDIVWDSAHGFDVDGMSVHIVFNNGIDKSVYSVNGEVIDYSDKPLGYAPEVAPGDVVVYKIAVKNGADSLTPILIDAVTDTLPAGVFDLSSVYYSGDNTNWTHATVSASTRNFPVDYLVYLSRGAMEDYYVKATVANSAEEGTYTNTAYMNIGLLFKESKADIIVSPPKTGTLTVSKTVSSENSYDPAPADAAFTFTIASEADAASFDYTIGTTSGTVANGGTITLQSGQSAVFAEFPVGDFTVTETAVDGYSTTVNGTTGTVYSSEMTAQASLTAAFQNTFLLRTAELSIKKTVEKEYAADTVPADQEYPFTVVIGTDAAVEYAYTVNGTDAGTITSGSTINLKADDVVKITVPVGVSYTVTEVTTDLANDFTTTVNGNDTNSASGTMTLDGASVSCVNTYKKHLADLTVTKEGADLTKDENQSFLFTVAGPDGFSMEVLINGNGSATIKDLPLGTYTVTENTDWSWRYTPTANDQSITLTAAGPNTVSFKNTRSIIYWLSGDCFCENQFTVNTSTSSN